jgi:hypothetical protein
MAARLNGRSSSAAVPTTPGQRNALPAGLKTGMEALSGIALDDVRVHRNSAKPEQLQAHAYAQGNEIHLGPGQDEHLPHEAWHVVQQKQGRVRPTERPRGGIALNTDPRLEHEADMFARKAGNLAQTAAAVPRPLSASPGTAQAKLKVNANDANADDLEKAWETVDKSGIDPSRYRAVYAVLAAWVKDKVTDRPEYPDWQKAFDAAVLAAPQPEVPSEESRRCVEAVEKMNSALLVPIIGEEIHAEPGPALEAYAKDVLQQLVTSLEKAKRDNEGIKKALRESIWVTFGKFYMLEDRETSTPYTLGTTVKSTNIFGFKVHFMRGTDESDENMVAEFIGRIHKAITGISPEEIATQAFDNFTGIAQGALDLKDKTTGKPSKKKVNTAAVKNVASSVTRERILMHTQRVVSRWQAAANGNIHVIVRRAKLKTAFGLSSVSGRATPDNLMGAKPASHGSMDEEQKQGSAPREYEETNKEGLDETQRVDINLDAMGSPEEFANTFAHEVAHSIGFNPTGMDNSGHLPDNMEYASDENGLGPKLLFDAYYFEMLMARLRSRS